MSLRAVFSRILDALNAASIPRMLTGSFASSYHGQPRATQDIDFVIDADVDRIRTLIRTLPKSEYYADEDAALEALREERQFNILDLSTGWKIDLIIRKSRAFSINEFSRRQIASFEGLPIPIATAEDVVIAKLEWARLGGSSRQIDDAAAIVAVRETDLDRLYIEHWVAELGLETQWQEVLARA